MSYFLQFFSELLFPQGWRDKGSYKDKEGLLSLKNKEEGRENKLEKDNEGGGLRQLLLIERGKA